MRWLPQFLCRTVCAHEFRYADLRLTGIPVPPTPARGASMAELNKWGDEVICGKHPSHTERVSWSCHKCGKEFRAHCGLDVLKHGTPIKIFRYDLDHRQRPAAP